MFAACAAPVPDQPSTGLQVLQTPAGTKFGVIGEVPEHPAPTLFVIGMSLGEMRSEPAYTEIARLLSVHGYGAYVLEPPCHGRDRRGDEPSELDCWAARIEAGRDLLGPFVEGAVDVLDYLVAEGHVDPGSIAAVGMSRGGFCAMHLAAVEPRIRAVAALSPVTELMALREFAENRRPDLARELDVSGLAGRLAGRAVWVSINREDDRVDAEACRRAAEALGAELVVGDAEGHSTIEGAHGLAAGWLLSLR